MPEYKGFTMSNFIDHSDTKKEPETKYELSKWASETFNKKFYHYYRYWSKDKLMGLYIDYVYQD